MLVLDEIYNTVVMPWEELIEQPTACWFRNPQQHRKTQKSQK